MFALSLRAKQFIVSLLGVLLIVPLDLFFGGKFSFLFGARETLWAWLFGLTAFWCQILGVLASLFRPRLAAAWMLLNIGLSVFIGVVAKLQFGVPYGAGHAGVAELLRAAPGYMRTAALYWLLPLAVALLLLVFDPAREREEVLSESRQ